MTLVKTQCGRAGRLPEGNEARERLLKAAGLYGGTKRMATKLIGKTETWGAKAKPMLNRWADRSEFGADMRNLYRKGREWYLPNTIDPQGQAIIDTVKRYSGGRVPQGLVEDMTRNSIAAQRSLKRDIVMAGLLPPAAMGVAGIGASMVIPPAYDAIKYMLRKRSSATSASEAAIVDAQNMLKSAAERNPDSLADLFAKLDPTTQRVLRNTVIGSLLGGAAGIGVGAMSPERSIGRSALAGGLLGAGGAGAGTLGMDLLTSKLRLPGEDRGRSLPDRLLVDPIADTAIGHPATTAGAIGGGIWGFGRRFDTNKAIQAAIDSDKAIAANLPKNFSGTMPAARVDVDAAINRYIAAKRALLTASPKGVPGPAFSPRIKELKNAFLAMHEIVGTRHKLYGRGVRSPWNWAAIPVGVGIGYMIDRYLKGKNR